MGCTPSNLPNWTAQPFFARTALQILAGFSGGTSDPRFVQHFAQGGHDWDVESPSHLMFPLVYPSELGNLLGIARVYGRYWYLFICICIYNYIYINVYIYTYILHVWSNLILIISLKNPAISRLQRWTDGSPRSEASNHLPTELSPGQGSHQVLPSRPGAVYDKIYIA